MSGVARPIDGRPPQTRCSQLAFWPHITCAAHILTKPVGGGFCGAGGGGSLDRQSKVSARNDDWQKIARKLQYKNGGAAGIAADHVVVMGDMNYRMDRGELTEVSKVLRPAQLTQKTLAHLTTLTPRSDGGDAQEELRLALQPLRLGTVVGHVPPALLACDQLRAEHVAGRVFVGFQVYLCDTRHVAFGWGCFDWNFAYIVLVLSKSLADVRGDPRRRRFHSPPRTSTIRTRTHSTARA